MILVFLMTRTLTGMIDFGINHLLFLIDYMYNLLQVLGKGLYTQVPEFRTPKLCSAYCLVELQKLSWFHFLLLVVPPSSLGPIKKKVEIQ